MVHQGHVHLLLDLFAFDLKLLLNYRNLIKTACVSLSSFTPLCFLKSSGIQLIRFQQTVSSNFEYCIWTDNRLNNGILVFGTLKRWFS